MDTTTTRMKFPAAAWSRLVELLPVQGLRALREALAFDDPRLMTRGTIAFQFSRVQRCCPLAFCFWQGGAGPLADEVRAAFEGMLKATRGRAALVVAWIDNTPWSKARVRLLAAVEAALGE